MYASFSRILGLVSVKETDSHIIVNGIPGLRFSRDIYNHWKTSKINNNLFTTVSRSSVKFPKFYAIEVLYIIEQLIQSRRTYVGRRLLTRVAEELTHSTWLRNIGVTGFAPRLDYKQLADLNVTLFPHQLNFLREYDRTTFEYSLQGMLMDVAAGGGKTLTNYALSICLRADTSIMVVPKNSVLDVWVKTINTMFKDTPEFWHSLSGLDPVAGKKHYIVHYDYLEKFLAFAKANKGNFGQVFVAIDESHNFNEQSARTNYLVELVQVVKARDVVHASGTPFKAMGSEAITLLKTVCRDFTPDVEASFRKMFGKEAKRALEILANRIGIVSFKVPKQDIETPGVDYHEEKVTIKNGQDYTLTSVRDKMSKFIEERLEFYRKGMKEYEALYAQCMDLHAQSLGSNNAAKTEFAEYKRAVATIRKGYDPVTMKDLVMFCNRYELKKIVPSLPDRFRKPFLNVRAIIKYVDLKVMGEALSQVLGRMRIQCHLDMLPHMPLDTIIDNASSKTVIFTSYVEVVKELDGLLSNAGYKPLLVYGDTNKDLTNIVKKFEQDPDANPLIATFKSLSTAVPLTMANTLVLTNSPFREYEKTQTIARVDRIGQKHRCHVFELFLDTGSEGNISTRSKDILAWSKSQVEAILGVQTPDDLEASLEALVEDPQANIDDGEQFIDRLRHMLPADTLPQEEVSMEGLFSKAPTGNIYKPQELLKTLKDTYLNSGWMAKQKFKDGTVRLENGHLANLKNAGETKRVLDKYLTEGKNRATTLERIAKDFLAGWKDPAKVAKWLASAKTDFMYGKYSKSEVEVIAKFGELPGMTNYTIGGVTTVQRLGEASNVTALAKSLESILSNDALSLYWIVEGQFTEKRFGAFHSGSDDDIELLYDIETSGLDHAKDAIKVFKLIKKTIEKTEADFMNSAKAATFEGHVQATYRAMWKLLTVSTK